MKPNDSFELFINQGHRPVVILAVIDGRALGEYEMPAGTTALIYLKQDAAGNIQPDGGVSYKACPLKWIKAIKDAGLEWIGNAQQGGRREWKDALAALDRKPVSQFAVGRRWKVNDWENRIRLGQEPFHFVVVGPGHNATHKRCRIEVPEQYRRARTSASYNAIEQEYSHAHIKKCATLEPT